jgi:phytoene dehydrogenase-like protein
MPVVRVDVEGRRATGVRTEDGQVFQARRAVIADVVAPNLYGGLVAPQDVPARTARSMRNFQLDPGTVKVDWALDGPVPWDSAPPYAPGTFHVADSVDQMAEALNQVASQTIPAAPFLLAGQMTTSDPTRSPAGTESMWAYTHVPQQTSRDAGDGTVRGVWDRDDCERFADRMQERLERLAPGFGSRILSRRVLGPRELEARNANLVGGAINGGTAQLHQELIFRPVPGLGRAETTIRGLYLGSASAHPGGGVHGAAGMNAARAALFHHRVRRVLPTSLR